MAISKKLLLLLAAFVAMVSYADNRSLFGLKGNVESVLSESGGCQFDRNGNVTMYNASCSWLSIAQNEFNAIEGGLQGNSYINISGERATCESVVYFEDGRIACCSTDSDYGCSFTYFYDSKGLPSETCVEQRGLLGFMQGSSMAYSNYKFDQKGNWVERTVKETGVDEKVRTYVEKRTIQYY